MTLCRFLRRILLWIICASLFTLTACDGTEGAPRTPTAAPAETVSLRVVTPFAGTDPHTGPYNQILAEFGVEYPLVEVRDFSSMSDEEWKARVVNDFNADNDPDVLFYFAGRDSEAFVEHERVVDIETIRGVYPEYARNISASALDDLRYSDGKVYAVPINGFYEGLFVNASLFERYGLALPTSWENLLIAGERFKAEGIVPMAAALGHIPHYLLDHLILSAGGLAEHRENPRSADRLPPGWVRGLEMLKSLYRMGMFPENTLTTQDEETKQLFLYGGAAMIVDGSWLVGQIPLKEPKESGGILQRDVKVLPFPRMPGGKAQGTEVIRGTSMGFYIGRKAWDDPAKREACARLVQRMTSDEAIARFMQPGMGGVPSANLSIPPAENGIDPGQMLLHAGGYDRPCLDRLSDPARNALISGIPGVAEGQVTATELLREVAWNNTR